MFQNCLGYALNVEAEKFSLLELNYSLKIEEAFMEKCQELGKEVRMILSMDDVRGNERLVLVYGFYDYLKNYGFYKEWVKCDFHVVWRKSNGIWTHKWDKDSVPEEVNWDEFRKEYPEQPKMFAVIV